MANANQTSNQFLTFTISGDQYAIPVTDVREVLVVPKITVIPRMPDFMKGILNLRGAVVPVLDFKQKFGMGETVVTGDTAIIVVEISASADEETENFLRLGIFADTVKKVITIREDQIEPPPKIGSKLKTSFIDGMGHVEDQFIVILDIRAVLSDEDIEFLAPMQVTENEPK